MQAIIYKNENGGVCIVYPTEEALKNYTIDEIAKKDVPFNVEYQIVDSSEIPVDRTFRNAWEAEIVADGVGAESNEFEKAKDDNNQSEQS